MARLGRRQSFRALAKGQPKTYTYGGSLTGLEITSAKGNVSSSITIALTGHGITASKGDVTAVTTYTIALSGIASTVSLESPLIPNLSKSLSGLSATASKGDVSLAISSSLTGDEITSSHDSVSPDISIALSGHAVTASQGYLTVQGYLDGLIQSLSKGEYTVDVSIPLEYFGIPFVTSDGFQTYIAYNGDNYLEFYDSDGSLHLVDILEE